MALAHHTPAHSNRKHKLKVVRLIAKIQYNGRIYRLLDVQTQEGVPYRCLRLHNADNHFIKQFLFEPELSGWLVQALTNP